MPTDRYSSNRNLWRKTTSTFRRQKPQLIELLDVRTQLSYSIDLTRITRERSPYERKPYDAFFMPELFVGEYEEGLIEFTDEVSQSFVFDVPFSGIPFIVFSVEEPSNVNVFGLEVTAEGATVGLSAPFSSDIRYRAIYSTTYPAIVSSSFSQSFTASAGSFVTDNSVFEFGDMATVQFQPVPDIRSSPVYVGPEPDYEPYDTNVAITHLVAEGSNVSHTGSVEIGISAPMSNNNEVHFIAVIGAMPAEMN